MHEIPKETTDEVAEFFFEGHAYHGERIERWLTTDRGGEASCGENVPITIESTMGVSETEETTLKRYCELSLGIKDIRLFKAGLERSLRSSINWNSGEKTTITVQLIAPKCGSLQYSIYRKAYIYRLKTYKRRLFRKPLLVDLPEFKELTRNYIARVMEQRDHPVCSCRDPERGMPVRVKLWFNDKLTAFVDGVIDSTRNLRFNLGAQRYEVNADEALRGDKSETLTDVPVYFQQLADLGENSEVEVRLWATPDVDAASFLRGWLSGAFEQPLPS